MKTHSELLDTPGVKGVRVHAQIETNRGRSNPVFTIDLFLLPEWCQPRLKERPNLNPKMRAISKVDMRAPLDADVLSFGRMVNE